MGVIEHTAVRLEGAHDLVQPLLRRVSNEGQAADPATALLFCIFVMHQNFVTEATHLLLREFRFVRVRHHDLEIGPAPIDLQRHQSRMIERRFVNAPQIGSGALCIADRH